MEHGLRHDYKICSNRDKKFNVLTSYLVTGVTSSGSIIVCLLTIPVQGTTLDRLGVRALKKNDTMKGTFMSYVSKEVK